MFEQLVMINDVILKKFMKQLSDEDMGEVLNFCKYCIHNSPDCRKCDWYLEENGFEFDLKTLYKYIN